MFVSLSRPGLGPIRYAGRVARKRWPAIVAATAAAAVPMAVFAANFNGLTTFDGGYQTAIQATSSGSTAISATSDPNSSGDGVYGSGYTGLHGVGQVTGVRGESNTGTGVYGVSNSQQSNFAVAAGYDWYGYGLDGFGAIGVHAVGHPYDGVGVDATGDATAIKARSSSGYGIDVSSAKTAGTFVSSQHAGVYANTQAVNTAAIDAYADAKGTTGVTSFGDSMGVYGEGGTGLFGRSYTGYGAELAVAQAPLRLDPATTTLAPTTGTHKRGELFVDSQGSLFLCVADGTPGTWKKVVLQ